MKLQSWIQKLTRRAKLEQADLINGIRIHRLARQVSRQAPEFTGQPLVFFNATTRLGGLSLNAAFSILSSFAMRMAGVKAVHFVCDAGMSRCVLGTNRKDFSQPPPCKTCQAASRRIYAGSQSVPFRFHPDYDVDRLIQAMSLEELMEFSYEGMPLGSLVLPSLRWVLRRHHLGDQAYMRFLYCQYILSAWSIARQFEALLDKENPRAVVVFNGMFYPEAAAAFIARRRGLKVITHEVGLRPNTGFFTPGEATAYPIDIPGEFELTQAQNQRLDDYLSKRFQGDFTMAGIRFWKGIQPLDEAFWNKARPYRQVVPVFTNVIFDTSQGHANTVFEHMFEWLDEVLKIITRHPDTFFVLRAHPDEGRSGKESQESVADWVKRRGVEQFPNVLFVSSAETISSYDLIRISKFVMVYNSTIGLEASLMGAAVLCAGRARFTQIPTVFFPQTVENFRRQAEEFLDQEKINVPEEYSRNARKFLYYQLFKTSLPFEDFVEEEGSRNGYVVIKHFDADTLKPEKSPAMHAIYEGLTAGGDFLLKDYGG